MNAIDELIKTKRKSTTRRSSLLACEALKLMNLSACTSRNYSDQELFEMQTRCALEWIDGQLKRFKQELSYSNKLVAKSKSNFNSTLDKEPSKTYHLLTDEHKQFLSSVNIPDEYIINVLKNKHKELIQVTLFPNIHCILTILSQEIN